MTRRWITGTIALVMIALVAGCGGKASAPAVSDGVRMFEAQDYDGARAYYENQLAGAPGDATAHYYLGRIAMAQAHYDDAVEQMKAAVEAAPENADNHFWLAMAYASQIQNTKDFMEQGRIAPLMKASVDKAVELDPENLDAREFLAQYLFNAPPIVGGDPVKGWEQVEFVKQHDPKRGHLLAARIHMRKKKTEEAEKEIQAAIALDPKDAEVHYQLGRLYQNAENYDAAFEAFESALALDPGHKSSLYQLGRNAAMSGNRLDRGVECLKKYLATKPGPDDPAWQHAHWRLGMIYEKQGHKDLARAEYEKALALDPEYEDAKKALEALGDG